MADDFNLNYSEMVNQDENDLSSPERLSDAQEKVLATLPIPSAILSIIGSAVIIFIALKSRGRQKWTTYTRLLIALSICDIFSSVNISISNFLRPSESPRAWAYGNDATCTATGFLTQVSYSAASYTAMLSFYFLLTARFGLKNTEISRRFEPLMHFISIGYFLGTAIVGAILGVYADTSVGLGCWVNDYPRNCGHEPGQTGEDCWSSKIGWVFFGYPFFLILASLIVNNLLIYIFVRKQTRPKMRKPIMSTDHTPTFNHDMSDSLDDSCGSSDEFATDAIKVPVHVVSDDKSATKNSRRRVGNIELATNVGGRTSTPHKDQNRRLRLVSSQAFLFVANYMVVTTWGAIMAFCEQQAETKEDELTMLVRIFPIMVLNAFFIPLQGFLNLLVYIRPKYLKWRHEYPRETRLWAVRRAILGEGVRPENDGGALAVGNPVTKPAKLKRPEENRQPELGEEENPVFTGLPKEKISSLTASKGDFDRIVDEDEEDDRWGGNNSTDSWIPLSTTPVRFCSTVNSSSRGESSLDVISEHSESVFESVVPAGSSAFEHTSISEKAFAIVSPPDSRWSPSGSRTSEGQQSTPNSSLNLNIPRRAASEGEDILEEDDSVVSSVRPDRAPIRKYSIDDSLHDASVDGPARMPTRRMSPPPSLAA